MLGMKSDASHNDINVSSQNELPGDTVSSISWCPDINNRLFTATSWDSKLRLYEVQAGNNSAKLGLKGAIDVDDPLLSAVWCDDDMTKLFGGSINGSVKMFDIQSGKSQNVGQHDHSVKDVYWVPKVNLVMSLSFDKTMRFWDCRSNQAAAAVDLGQKVFCSNFMFPYIGIGLGDERLIFFDLNNLQSLQNKSIETYESPLGKGSQLTAVGFTLDGSGFGIGSHDGRVHISKFGQDNLGKLKFEHLLTFKAKKYDQNVPTSKQILYPVHDIGFHPMSKGFVFTSGGDGSVTYWDFVKKERITNYDYQGTPVTRCKMSPDGLLMAYALGYDWSMGIQGYMSHSARVCVHVMKESDLVPKPSI